MFKLGISGILWDDVPEDGGSRTGGPHPVCLFLFTMGLPVPVLYVMIFLIGITKGMITIINNHAIRQVTGSSNQYLNLLHMWYAVGLSCPHSLRCSSWERV